MYPDKPQIKNITQAKRAIINQIKWLSDELDCDALLEVVEKAWREMALDYVRYCGGVKSMDEGDRRCRDGYNQIADDISGVKNRYLRRNF